MKTLVEVADQVRKVAMKLDYISNNTRDEGLAFIIDECVEELTMAKLTMAIHGENDDDPTKLDPRFN